MTEFCTCGSIMINEHCSNKNCAKKAPGKTSSTRSRAVKSNIDKVTGLPKEPKVARTKRASKCITYNLYEIDKEEESVN